MSYYIETSGEIQPPLYADIGNTYAILYFPTKQQHPRRSTSRMKGTNSKSHCIVRYPSQTRSCLLLNICSTLDWITVTNVIQGSWWKNNWFRNRNSTDNTNCIGKTCVSSWGNKMIGANLLIGQDKCIEMILKPPSWSYYFELICF